MDIYLPIAGQSVNALLIVALGLLVGLLSGMFGVGGGFLTTPLLIVYGITPTVAAASSASQVTGASVSGVFAHFARGGVDLKLIGFANYQQLLFGLERSHFLGVLKTPSPLGWAIVIVAAALATLAWVRAVRGGVRPIGL